MAVEGCRIAECYDGFGTSFPTTVTVPKQHVCNDCARERGEMPRPTSSAPIRDTAYRQRKWTKHTEGSPESPLNGVWNTCDTNTVHQWQDEALTHGALEIETGRSTSVIHVRGHQVGEMQTMRQPVGNADAVQIPMSSNSSYSHPFPFNSDRLSEVRCMYCGDLIDPPPR